jgi:hypothetical protein
LAPHLQSARPKKAKSVNSEDRHLPLKYANTIN